VVNLYEQMLKTYNEWVAAGNEIVQAVQFGTLYTMHKRVSAWNEYVRARDVYERACRKR
jgi:hypothetical protein